MDAVGIEGGSLIMVATCFVISPRLAGRIKSELLFEIINKLHQESILLSMPLQIEQINPTRENVN
jgi:potassium efflux system protein